MPNVFRLAYVDLSTASLDDALEYYTGVVGATITEAGNGAAYLSLGLDHHNIALHAGPSPGLGAIGLQVGHGVPLDDLARQLRGQGLAADLRSDSRPGVATLLEVPVAGHTFHLFGAMDTPAPGFGTRGIVPNRIGHLAVLTPGADKLISFLADGLGFWTTDWFEEQVTFVTCNRDHHVLNVIQAPMVAAHHLAFELRGRDHQFHAMDQLARAGRPIVWGPSRHTAGHNLASYHYGADNLLVELYADMDVYSAASSLGHGTKTCRKGPSTGPLPR